MAWDALYAGPPLVYNNNNFIGLWTWIYCIIVFLIQEQPCPSRRTQSAEHQWIWQGSSTCFLGWLMVLDLGAVHFSHSS